MQKYLIVIPVLFLCTGKVAGQDNQFSGKVIYGKIIDALDSLPVEAKITFESLPDNSDVHIGESAKETGIFNVRLYKNADYSILVDAPYYKPEMDTIRAGDLGRFDLLYRLLPVRPGQVLRLQKIYFSKGGFNILESSKGELTEILYLLNKYPRMEIRLEGHTDLQGGRQSNMELSEKRVKAIRNYLVAAGIHPKRIRIRAFGNTRPVSTENTDAAHQANRRVEARILKI